MAYIPLTTYENSNPDVQAEYNDQIAKHGRITNMKRTMLHDVPTFKAYMEWYTLYDEIVPWLGERPLQLFSYAISSTNNCLVCSTFFRKILIDSGDDPDNPKLNAIEKILVEFGTAVAHGDAREVPQEIYNQLRIRFSDKQLVQLIGFAGLMYATNLFNNIAKVPLDDVLTGYTAPADKGTTRRANQPEDYTDL